MNFLDLAMREILSDYGAVVSLKNPASGLLKFGRNAGLGTSLDTVWEYGGNETYVDDNLITHVSSSSASDTATVMTVIGCTLSGGNFTNVTQNVTLNGQNAVALATPLARAHRAYVSSGTLAGDFYVAESDTLTGGVPDTAAKVHLTVEGATSGHTQTFKCATTLASDEYAIITGGYAAVTKKQAASVDFVFEGRSYGGVFRPIGGRIALNSAGQSVTQIRFEPYLIATPNMDLRIRAASTAAGTEVDASFMAIIARAVS